MSKLRFLRAALTAILISAATAAQGAPVSAPDRELPLPKQLDGVDVKEQLGKSPALNLAFTDERGKPVMLRDYFDGSVPVIVTFNYSNCPMLCSLQLNGFVEGLKQLDFTPGQEFRIVTVSIDPTEKPERALATQRKYLAYEASPKRETADA